MTTDLLTALATYIRVLSEAVEQTKQAKDHRTCMRHLAVSVQMFVAAYQDIDLEGHGIDVPVSSRRIT